MNTLRTLFAWTAFPLILGASLAIAANSSALGLSPEAAFAAPTAGAALLILALERIFPAYASWQRSHGDVLVDLSHAVSVSLTNRIAQLAIPLLLLPPAGALASNAGLGLWPAHWHWLAQLALALVIAEFFQYWLHRLMHERDALWRFHATHHSAPRLYFLNAARFHPIDILLDTSIGLTPLVLLGAPAETLALFALFGAVLGYLQHSNLELRLGPLNYLFSMAELHRWHHSRDLRQANTNYGSNLSIWDLAFRTFFWPRGERPPETIGIPNLAAFPHSYLAQLASPFRWRAIRDASARDSA
jgi:sterol desaturase/sphingolipid hydroxylase (fatty acid hydroxylase superfamily)